MKLRSLFATIFAFLLLLGISTSALAVPLDMGCSAGGYCNIVTVNDSDTYGCITTYFTYTLCTKCLTGYYEDVWYEGEHNYNSNYHCIDCGMQWAPSPE